MSYLGYPKVEAAERRLKAINPNLQTDPLAININSENADDVVSGVDVVIDGLDRLEPRYSLNRACLSKKVPYIFGSAIESYGNASTIIPNETACLECMLGRIDDDNMPTCDVVGVYPQILSIIASIQVKEALNIILGHEPMLSNRLLFADIESMDFRIFQVARTPNCGVCGTSKNVIARKSSQVVQLCGKESFSISGREELSLDLEELAKVLSTRFKIVMKTDFALTISYTERVYAVLMKTGNMLIHGAKDKEEALNIYEEILDFAGDC
ncbi:MAG: HesA/MoeB/ThiF family protein [Thermoproteota archaeon]